MKLSASRSKRVERTNVAMLTGLGRQGRTSGVGRAPEDAEELSGGRREDTAKARLCSPERREALAFWRRIPGRGAAGRAFAALSLFAFSCSSPPPAAAPEPCDKQVVSAAIIALAHLNPAESGESRPVQLRLYQLKNDVAFRNASFERIWKEDEAILGSDLVAREEFPVYPDSQKSVDFERNPEAEYVVAAGLFREPKGKQWFVSFELPPPPGQEACGAKCADGKCAEPVDLNPKIYVKLEGTRVEDGSALAQEFESPSVTASVVRGGSL